MGGAAIATIVSAICWRLAPATSPFTLWGLTLVLPGLIVIAGAGLLIRSDFLRLLGMVRTARAVATPEQRAHLARLTPASVGLVVLMFVGGLLVLFAPMSDGRLGFGDRRWPWGVFVVGQSLFLFSGWQGTLLRFREIEILSRP